MRRNVRSLLVAGVVGIPTAALLAGCGGGLPADAVAKIDGTTITKKTYDRTETYVNALSYGPQSFTGKTANIVDFRPPYKNCIAAIKKSTPKPAKGQPPVSDAQILPICKQTWDGIKTQAAVFPLRAYIAEAEAKDYKITVTPADVTKELPNYLQSLIGGQANVAKFTAATKLPASTFRDDLRTQLLIQKIQEKVAKDAGVPSAAQIRAQYERTKNQAPLGSPETRDLRVVLTKTKAEADAAKKKIDGGRSFASVARADSIDQTSRAQGGLLKGVQKGREERSLEAAAFAAKQGQVVGPIQTESGFYVVRVDKINAAKAAPFAQAQGQIRIQLTQQRSEAAKTKWQNDTTKKWKAKTECRKGYVVEFCKGAKPAATTQAAPASDPGGGQAVPAS